VARSLVCSTTNVGVASSISANYAVDTYNENMAFGALKAIQAAGAAFDKLGKLTKKDDGSMEIEIPSQMITKDNAKDFFCKGFGDDPECK
jgi:ribose transport system substrate-binding protein